MEFCDDCYNIVDKTFPLLCEEHTICRKCLVLRARHQPSQVMRCIITSHGESEIVLPQAKASDESNTDNGIWIFVDDSTIWVEAKKLQSTRKGYLTSEDHRLRIDMRKLASFIANDRPVKKGILYAAEPPPIYEVWRNIESKAGWDVDRSELKMSSGEKQINAKLVAKATATAILTPCDERTTMAFVTGDANVVPALKKVVDCAWQVEIYMWSDAISSDIHSFAADHEDQVKIRALDDQLNFICFHCYDLNVHLKETGSNIKTWMRRRQPMCCGAVFSMEPGAFPNHTPSMEWIEELETITKWPFQFHWFLDANDAKTENLVVTFKMDANAGMFDLANFLQNDSVKKLPHVISATGYHEFIGKEYSEETSLELEKIDEALDQCQIQRYSFSPDRSMPSDSDSSSVGDNSGFRRSTTRKTRQSKQLYSTPCKYKKNCKFGTSCYSHHTKEEKEYFRKRKGGRGNKYRKTTLCPYYLKGNCYNSKDECGKAHGEKDAFCLKCYCEGHFQDNCTKKQE